MNSAFCSIISAPLGVSSLTVSSLTVSSLTVSSPLNVARLILALLFSGIVFASNPATAVAQSFRYMDEAGTLHWADSLQEVPRQYRNQILAPTPVPTYKKGKPPRPPKAVKTKKPKPTRRPPKHPGQKPPKLQRYTPVPENAPTIQVPVPALMPPGMPVAQPTPEALMQAPPGVPPVAAPGIRVAPVAGISVQNEVAFEGAKADASLAIVAKP